MSFTQEVKELALIKCKRHCVLCEKNKGVAMECHHIKPKAKGGEDSFENCIPVCFDCHQTLGSYNPKHPKGNKFSENELIARRDNFYRRVENGEFPKDDINNLESAQVQKANKYDIELFERIKEMFNSPNLQYYLTEYDLSNDFDNRVFSPLTEFIYLKSNPEYRFVDEEIERYNILLTKSVEEFVGFKGVNTFVTKLGTQAIKTWRSNYYSYEESSSINNKFNNLATDIWRKYSDLVRICKYKLC